MIYYVSYFLTKTLRHEAKEVTLKVARVKANSFVQALDNAKAASSADRSPVDITLAPPFPGKASSCDRAVAIHNAGKIAAAAAQADARVSAGLPAYIISVANDPKPATVTRYAALMAYPNAMKSKAKYPLLFWGRVGAGNIVQAYDKLHKRSPFIMAIREATRNERLTMPEPHYSRSEVEAFVSLCAETIAAERTRLNAATSVASLNLPLSSEEADTELAGVPEAPNSSERVAATDLPEHVSYEPFMQLDLSENVFEEYFSAPNAEGCSSENAQSQPLEVDIDWGAEKASAEEVKSKLAAERATVLREKVGMSDRAIRSLRTAPHEGKPRHYPGIAYPLVSAMNQTGDRAAARVAAPAQASGDGAFSALRRSGLPKFALLGCGLAVAGLIGGAWKRSLR
jgi:hypothetical protein